ncbi:MAG: NADH-quinone oxidoreductase subunit NuoH [Armatimonadota bacterium]|nr:NADH-quinone oxidoreductase subunit NuoH [Armatimonadota bacterium]MCX7776988.1 NADH-quinone oxidoreductase subunit NuoH [Armatimonadota bacterium]MDW8024822.1 NADH-quinone oxidoreductase subunit NuoH [Armatimonadota bacterium]
MSLTQLCERLLNWTGLPVEVWVGLVVAVIIFLFMTVIVLAVVYLFRKFAGFIQLRLGPRYVGPRGVLQTVCDAVKLLAKEDIIPAEADKGIFIAAPLIVFLPAYLAYIVIPFGQPPHFQPKDLNLGILYVLAITSITVVGIITAGWASGSKWATIGGMRSGAQLISYEVPMSLAVLVPVLISGSLSMKDIAEMQGDRIWYWNAFNISYFGLAFIAFVIYMICALAETNQIPFDLPEAESELVAGYNVEYSGMRFAFFFLAEFSNLFVVCAIATTLFLGGWYAPLPFLPDDGFWSLLWFMLKTLTLVFIVLWIRSTYPRVRIDQLMEFAWKRLFPIALIDLGIVSLIVALR